MSDDMKRYDELADRAERGELKPVGQVKRGAAAAAAGQAMLLRATGATSLDEAVEVTMGRPRLGEGRPTVQPWKVKPTAELDAAARRLAQEQGMTLSQLVRDATRDYLRANLQDQAAHEGAPGR